MKKNWLVKSYLSLPLWGKVAVPAAGAFLVISVLKTLKWAFWLGLLGLVAYFIASAVLYFKDKRNS